MYIAEFLAYAKYSNPRSDTCFCRHMKEVFQEAANTMQFLPCRLEYATELVIVDQMMDSPDLRIWVLVAVAGVGVVLPPVVAVPAPEDVVVVVAVADCMSHSLSTRGRTLCFDNGNLGTSPFSGLGLGSSP